MKNSRKAFTLLEVMVTVLIFSIIAAALFMVLTSGKNSWLSGKVYTEVQQEIRKSREWVTKELSQARNSTLQMPGSYITGNVIHSSSIIFQVPLNISDGGGVSWQAVTYYLGGLNNKQLLRDINGDIKVIANDIVSVDFAREQDKPLLIYVTITAAKQEPKGQSANAVLKLKLKFRN